MPWSDSEYLRIVSDVKSILTNVQSDLVVLDPLCTFGTDACRKLGVRAISLGPVGWSMMARFPGDANERMALAWPSCVTCILLAMLRLYT